MCADVCVLCAFVPRCVNDHACVLCASVCGWYLGGEPLGVVDELAARLGVGCEGQCARQAKVRHFRNQLRALCVHKHK